VAQLLLRIGKDVFGVSPADLDASVFKRLISNHASPAVHREALLLMRDADPHSAMFGIYELAKKYDGKDRFYLAAIGIAVGHHDKERRDILLADFNEHFPTWNEKVANLVWELRPPKLLPLLEKRLSDSKIPADQRARIVDILAGSTDKDAGKALLKL